MAVIDAKLIFSKALAVIDPANRAFPVLRFNDLFVLLKRQSISTLDLDLKIDSSFFFS
jgi:hypothetical protein